MSARNSRTVLALLLATGLAAGCTSTGSSSGGVKWPWTKAKPALDEGSGAKHADVLGTPPAPKTAKAGVNKPSLLRNDQPSVTLRTPRIIDDREINRAAR